LGQGETNEAPQAVGTETGATFQRNETCNGLEKGDTALAVAARCGQGGRDGLRPRGMRVIM